MKGIKVLYIAPQKSKLGQQKTKNRICPKYPSLLLLVVVTPVQIYTLAQGQTLVDCLSGQSINQPFNHWCFGRQSGTLRYSAFITLQLISNRGFIDQLWVECVNTHTHTLKKNSFGMKFCQLILKSLLYTFLVC